MKLETVYETLSNSPLSCFFAGGFLVYLLGVITTSELFFFLSTILMISIQPSYKEDTLQIQFVRKDSRAIPPRKGEPQAAGHDLSIISVNSKSNNITVFDTGLSIQPPTGYHTEIFPRSSTVSRYGYMLGNSIGLIDEGYRGNLLLCMVKVDETKPEPPLGTKIAQLVLRKTFDYEMVPVGSLSDSVRGTGGFGSTDSKSE